MKDSNDIKIKDFLIFGHNYIGDALTLTPAVRALKIRFPESRITAVVSKNASPVLRRNPDIYNIVETDKINGLNGIAGFLRLRSALKSINKANGHKFYVCVNFLTSLKFSVLGFLLAEKQIGEEKFFNGFFFRNIIKFDKNINNIDKSLKFIEPFYINPDEKYFARDYVYNVSETDIKNAVNILRNSFNRINENFKFVLFSPGSTRRSKEADPSLFSLFADFLNKKGFYVVITGSKKDAGISQKIYDKIENKHKSVNLTGLTDLFTLGGLIRESSLVVTVDNGTMHLSSAIKTPVIALFGSTDPAVCGPLAGDFYAIDKKTGCYHCFYKNCLKNGSGAGGYPDCMRSIKTQDLIDGFEFFLNSNKIKY